MPPSERGRLGGPLPVALTSFVGREREVAAVADLLRQDGGRLVTLTGPAGVGKTRLALRVAEELAPSFADGAVFVDLVPVSDAALVVPTVAHALGVRHAGDRPVAGRLAGMLRDRQLLLVLDGFEHAVEAAPAVADLLRASAGLRVLVTSRTLLHVSGEQNYPVQPLPVPKETVPLEQAAGAAAVRLFVQRARAADPAFAVTSENVSTIAAICHRLDGLPLALELAAAKIGLLPPPALLARLERRLSVLTGGARDLPARLRTMRDAVAWSHDLLPDEQQVLFRRLAVFVGGFDLEAAEAVAGQDDAAGPDVVAGVEALAEESLVRALESAGEAVRFSMLETTREFGLERLAAAGEEEQARQAHAAHYLALAERAEQDLLGPRPEAWLARLAAEHGNLAAALTCFAEREEVAACAGLAAALREYWYASGRWAEGRAWLEWAVARAPELPDRIAAKAFVAAGFLAHYQGDDSSALPLLERGFDALRQVGDEREEAYAQYLLGVAAEDRGDYAAATELLAEAGRRMRSLGDATNAAYDEAHLGIVALGESDPARAAAHGEAALALAAEAGSRDPTAVALLLLGDAARDSGDLAAAAERYGEYLKLTAAQGEGEDLARAVAAVAVLAVERGQPERAARLLGAAERLRDTFGLALALPERGVCEQASARARDDLGEETFGKAVAEGRALTPWEALVEVERILGLRAPRSEASDAVPAGLSRREAEVLRLIAAGRTNREIAQALFLSVRTVERHITNLYAKIGARGRADATAFALRHGLV